MIMPDPQAFAADNSPGPKPLYKRKSFWIGFVVVGLFIGALFIGFSHKRDLTCQGVAVQIDSIQGGRFFESPEVQSLLTKMGIEPVGKPMQSMDLALIESVIQQIPAVKNVEAYFDGKGVLKIDIRHRIPVLRIFNAKNQSYYVDEDGRLLKPSQAFSADVPLASGHIAMAFSNELNLLDTTRQEGDSKDEKQLKDLFSLALFLRDHEAWNALTEQVWVDENGEWTLIPRLGDQTILFGNADDMEGKFAKLKALYQDGFNKLGWDSFSVINLKYKGQVVCATDQTPVIDMPDSTQHSAPVAVLTPSKIPATPVTAKSGEPALVREGVKGKTTKTDVRKQPTPKQASKPAGTKKAVKQAPSAAKPKSGTTSKEKKAAKP